MAQPLGQSVWACQFIGLTNLARSFVFLCVRVFVWVINVYDAAAFWSLFVSVQLASSPARFPPLMALTNLSNTQTMYICKMQKKNAHKNPFLKQFACNCHSIKFKLNAMQKVAK